MALAAPEGFYDPASGERFVLPGTGHDPVLARMVSLHESVHAFLDSSTSFGHAVKVVGCLLEAGNEAFRPLYRRLHQGVVETHETYATVAGLCAATDGSLDRNRLTPYPSYLRYLDSFTAAFEGAQRPFLALNALASLARASMQTDIDALLASLPCDEWPAHALPLRQVPDARLYRLLRPEPCRRAMDAMDRVLRGCQLHPPIILEPGGDPALERETLRQMGAERLERLNIAAFDVFAGEIEASGDARPQYNGHREHLPALVARMRGFLGPGIPLDIQIVADDGPDADLDNVFMQFRHERLLLRDTPDDAIFVTPNEVGPAAAAEFTLLAAGRSYVQFVAMPAEKAQHLYRITHGQALLDTPHHTVAGLRRRGTRPGMPPRIEFLVLDPASIAAFLHARPDVRSFGIVSHASFVDPSWEAHWAACIPLDRCPLAVLIDTDPFALIESEARRGRIRITRSGVRLGDAAGTSIEFLCLDASATPGVLYLTPCSAGLRDAVVEFVKRRVPEVLFDKALLDGWHDIMPFLAGHLLAEERCFGAHFW